MTLVDSAHRLAVALLVVAAAACAGRQAAPSPAPSAPEVTVAQFLAATNANDLDRMASLWGDERGPSNVTNVIPRDERTRRLRIMQTLLTSDEHRVTGVREDSREERVLQVELVRGSNRFVVPFTVVAARTGGWLIRDVGLEAAMPRAQPRGN